MAFPYGQDFKEARPFGSYIVRKRVSFDGTAGGGEAATPVPVFTVTDAVYVMVTGICEESLAVGDGATIELGTTTDPDGLIATTTAADVDIDQIWFNATPAAIEVLGSIGGAFICEEDIVITVAVDDVTDGVILFTCFWTPLSETGTVIAS
jgi:hypothetical protein